ncbi:MAG TPA: TolC family protein [Verrucomicrobiales bacterium]|nr:TolC family protein [Verrucomicrobiales bacterium]
MNKRIVLLCLFLSALYSRNCMALDESSSVSETSASFESFVAEVLEGNPELQFYEAEIGVAKGGRRQAGIYPNPELSTGIGQKRLSGGGLSEEGLAWSVSVMQTFEYPGRIVLRKTIANHDVELAQLGLQQFQTALKARANEVAFGLLSTQRKAEASTEVAERLRELSEMLVQRDPAGVTPLIEIRVVSSAVVVFRKRAIEASQELQSALFEANLLRGKPLGTSLKIEDFTVQLPSPPSLERLLAAAQRNNFELKMQQIELEQQGFKVKLSHNEKWPEISIGPFISQEDAGERETIAGIGISLPLPLWNGNAGNIAAAKSRELQARTSLHLIQLKVEQTIMELSLAYRLRLNELNHWGDDVLNSFQEAAELGDRHYRLGSLPIGTYMELQREYLDAVEAIVELQVEAIEAREQLEVQTGLAYAQWNAEEEVE